MNTDLRDHDHDKANQWIDDALAEYAKTEPRAGFERRVSARLQVAEEQAARNGWWRWVFAIGVAAMFLLTLLWLEHPNGRQVSRTQITTAAPRAAEPAAKVRRDGSASRHIAPSKRDGRELAKVTVNHSLQRTLPPKQQQFPAALPLTDQERMLMQYVQDFPEKAALVAQAQTDLQKQNELDMGSPGPEKEQKGLDRKQ